MAKFEEIVTAGMISIMSFFGWNFDEYKNVLPQTIQSIGEEIIEAKDALTPETKPTEPIPEVKDPQTKTDIKQPLVTPMPTVDKPAQQVLPPPPKPEPEKLTTEQKIKSAVGNIFCTIIEAGRVKKITGSAVAISANGVMLTNAHVAEHLLLENTGALKNVSCFIRSGSPAVRAYHAEVIYLPTEWVMSNKDNLKYSSLTGTGENDYALIVLTKKVNSSASNLSFITPQPKDLSVGQSIMLAGYPAFGGTIIDNALYSVIENSSIKDIWPLNRTKSDLAGSAPSILAVNGSSGGAVATKDGELIGIMVATTLDVHSGRPNMRIISLSYISKDIQSKTGKSLDSYIQNADSKAQIFIQGEGKRLAEILVSNSK